MKGDHFFVRVNNVYCKVPLAKIIYLEAGSNQVQLICSGSQSILIRGSLETVLRMLPAASFCRIHESYAVAVEKIVSFDNTSVWIGSREKNIELPMGRFHKKLLEEKIWVLGEKQAKK